MDIAIEFDVDGRHVEVWDVVCSEVRLLDDRGEVTTVQRSAEARRHSGRAWNLIHQDDRVYERVVEACLAHVIDREEYREELV